MTPVAMPKANENLTEATLDRWLVKEGDSVAKDQSLCDIITDKAKFEMPAPVAGRVLKIYGPERAMLPVGYILCVIGSSGEAAPDNIVPQNEALLREHRSAATTLNPASGPSDAGLNVAGAGSGVRATPAARRLAKESGIDLGDVMKTLNLSAPITEKDIKTYLDKKK